MFLIHLGVEWKWRRTKGFKDLEEIVVGSVTNHVRPLNLTFSSPELSISILKNDRLKYSRKLVQSFTGSSRVHSLLVTSNSE